MRSDRTAFELPAAVAEAPLGVRVLVLAVERATHLCVKVRTVTGLLDAVIASGAAHSDGLRLSDEIDDPATGAWIEANSAAYEAVIEGLLSLDLRRTVFGAAERRVNAGGEDAYAARILQDWIRARNPDLPMRLKKRPKGY